MSDQSGWPPAAAGPPQPPNSPEAERAVLGAVLLSDRTLHSYTITDQLRPDDFYSEKRGQVFAVMLDLFAANQPIDVLTVTTGLQDRGQLDAIGGSGEIDALTADVPAVGNLRHYGQVVKDRAVLRRLLTATYQTQGDVWAHELTTAETVEAAERRILDVAARERPGELHGLGDALQAELTAWQAMKGNGRDLLGPSTGFRDLDQLTKGLRAGALLVLAARPSMGKSALVVNLAESVALHPQHPLPVALFSLEMSEAELCLRLVASQASIRADALSIGDVGGQDRWRRVLDAAGRLDASPLLIDDTADTSVLDIRSKCRRAAQQHGQLGLIIVDYLQLIRPAPGGSAGENRNQEVAAASRALKILAREQQCTVIAVSQLSRAVEQRVDRRPRLSDLRDSGAIEQDADQVAFLYRDDYYNPDSDKPGEAEIIVSKNRQGALGTVDLVFQPEYPRFRSKVR